MVSLRSREVGESATESEGPSPAGQAPRGSSRRRGAAKRTRSIAAVIEEAQARHLVDSDLNATAPAGELPSEHVGEPAPVGAAVQLHSPAEQQQAVPSEAPSDEDADSSSDDDEGAGSADRLPRAAPPAAKSAGRSLSHQGAEPHEPGLTPGAPAVEAPAGMEESDDDLSSDDEPANEDAELLARLTEGLFSSLVPSSQQQPQRPLAGRSGRWQQQQPANLLDGATPREQGHDGAAAGDAAALEWQPKTGLPGVHVQPLQQLPPSRQQQLEKQLTSPPRAALAKAARRHAPDTAGKDWFDLPAQTLTEDVKRDLRLLRLRGAFDPKRHYKSFDHKKFPRHFQIGTVVESAADFHSGRLAKKQRKRTLTDELLADAELNHARKKRFNKLQDEAAQLSSNRAKQKGGPARLRRQQGKAKH